MYFSGHMLDTYGEHASDLSHIAISEICEKDAEGSYLYSDRDKVAILGIITGVTVKTTRNNEQMAFFKLEDRHGEIECICFAKAFKECGAEIFLENAVYVEGTVSFKDEEQPKIIINSIVPLVENESYKGKPKQYESQRHADKEEKTQMNSDTSPLSPLSMYLSMYAMSINAENPQAVEKKAPARPVTNKPAEGSNTPTKVYLRVENMQNEKFLKAKNLVDIFNEGTVKVIFYDMSTKKYQEYSEKINYSEYALNSLRQILGEENVVLK